MPQRVAVRAYASSANLGHGLDFLGLALDAAWDEVTAERGPGPGRAAAHLHIEVAGRGADGVPTAPEANTAGRAVQTLLDAHDLREPVRLSIHKGIRPGSGLGSSAASAAAAVTAVGELLGLRLTDEQRVRFAAEGERAAAGAAHADNAAAAICGGMVIVTGGADAPCIARVTAPGRPALVVALPEAALITRDARAALPETISLRAYCDGAARAALAVAAWREGDLRAFGAAIEGSFADAARAPLVPGLPDAAAAARAAGAAGVAISGAGPALLAVLEDAVVGAAVGAAMQAAFARHGLACEILRAGVAPGARVIEVDG